MASYPSLIVKVVNSSATASTTKLDLLTTATNPLATVHRRREVGSEIVVPTPLPSFYLGIEEQDVDETNMHNTTLVTASENADANNDQDGAEDDLPIADHYTLS